MSPRRFELSWDRKFGYRVTVPRLLPEHGDRMAVREDIITEGDIEAVARFLGGSRSQRTRAKELLALVLGSDKEGEDA